VLVVKALAAQSLVVRVLAVLALPT